MQDAGGAYPGWHDAALVFGVGAQKAGTSWLFDALSVSPDVHVRCDRPGDLRSAVKEAHYFDRGSTGVARRIEDWQQKLEKGVARLAQMPPGDGKLKLARRMKARLERLAIYAAAPDDHSEYLGWLSSGYRGQKVILDITPSYAMLGAQTYADMAGLWPRTRFIFILRDPVDRLWSAVRYHLQGSDMPDEAFEAKARRVLENRYLSGTGLDDTPNRSNYADTLEALGRAVPSGDVLYLFYEDLFQPRSLDRVGGFLGIDIPDPVFEKRSNAGRRAELPEELQVRAAETLAAQYAHVAAVFGDALPQRWRDRMDLIGAGQAKVRTAV